MQPTFFRRYFDASNKGSMDILVSRLGLNRPEAAWLVPARGFIAIGWLRACAEKLLDPNWSSGETLRVFLEAQQSFVAFPFYSFVTQHLFLPYLRELAFIVLLGQWLVGLGILFGGWTKIALLAGIFMNLNFLLMGRPDPNAFYIVIQWMLFAAGADRIMSLDAFLKQYKAITDLNKVYFVTTALLGFLAISVLPFVKSFSPGQIVKDPVAVLIVLFVTIGLSTAFLALQKPKSTKKSTNTNL